MRSLIRAFVPGLSAVIGLVLLSGCGVLNIRTSAEPGGPVGVGIQATAGPSPTPTETGPEVPEGVVLERVDFGGECPVPVTIGMPEGWSFISSPSSFQLATSGGGSFDGPSITVNCRDAMFGDSATDVVTSRERYAFSEAGSSVLAQRKGPFGNGYFWSYQAELSPSEILALGRRPTMSYGMEMGYSVAGKLYQISYAGSAQRDDAPAREELKAAARYIEVDGQMVVMPDWVG